jgi:hypothetical protein
MTITVNLCVKEQSPYLNYHFSSFQVGEVNFPNKITVEEVKNLPSRERKQYIRILKATISTTISFLSLSSKSMAGAMTTGTQQVVNTGLPLDLIEPILELIKLALGGSVLLTVLLLIGAGAMRQFRKKKESAEWTNDIIRGFIQILIATPLVFLLYYVTTLLLGNFGQFLNPFATS